MEQQSSTGATSSDGATNTQDMTMETMNAVDSTNAENMAMDTHSTHCYELDEDSLQPDWERSGSEEVEITAVRRGGEDATTSERTSDFSPMLPTVDEDAERAMPFNVFGPRLRRGRPLEEPDGEDLDPSNASDDVEQVMEQSEDEPRPTQAPTLRPAGGDQAGAVREGVGRVIYVTSHGEKYHLMRDCRWMARANNVQRMELFQGCCQQELQRQPLYKHVGPVLHMDPQHAWSLGFRTLEAQNVIGAGEVARVGRHFRALTICRECYERRERHRG